MRGELRCVNGYKSCNILLPQEFKLVLHQIPTEVRSNILVGMYLGNLI